ncbi:MAG: hypothetical protein CMM42_08475 [Rhodospirillaceae bacterium]|nr:hypothetical protein [Rhodospirillaceae bacterium]
MKRKDTATIQLKVRMKESLRAMLEEESGKKEISLNAEVVERIERSFEKAGQADEIRNAVSESIVERFGGQENFEFWATLANGVNRALAIRDVPPIQNDWQSAEIALGATIAMYRRLAPQPSNLASEEMKKIDAQRRKFVAAKKAGAQLKEDPATGKLYVEIEGEQLFNPTDYTQRDFRMIGAVLVTGDTENAAYAQKEDIKQLIREVREEYVD